jgi:hypothetical protein
VADVRAFESHVAAVQVPVVSYPRCRRCSRSCGARVLSASSDAATERREGRRPSQSRRARWPVLERAGVRRGNRHRARHARLVLSAPVAAEGLRPCQRGATAARRVAGMRDAPFADPRRLDGLVRRLRKATAADRAGSARPLFRGPDGSAHASGTPRIRADVPVDRCAVADRCRHDRSLASGPLTAMAF